VLLFFADAAYRVGANVFNMAVKALSIFIVRLLTKPGRAQEGSHHTSSHPGYPWSLVFGGSSEMGLSQLFQLVEE
jgi:hypothetical protein